MTQLADRPTGHGETLTAAVQDVALGAQALTMVQALNRALHDAMAADERVLVFGEDVAVQGGVFRVTEGLAEAFGESRCFDTPLAESAIIGIAVGLALRGFVPVPEIQFDGFSYPAFDQVVSHLAKYRTRTRGAIDMPVTVRVPSFGGIGAAEHHSESTESYWAHTAGLKVVVPSNPADAYWLLRHAIARPIGGLGRPGSPTPPAWEGSFGARDNTRCRQGEGGGGSQYTAGGVDGTTTFKPAGWAQ